MMDEYKPLYESGPTSVGLVLTETRAGDESGDTKSLHLRGMLSGETEGNLVFDELRSLNIAKNSNPVVGSKAFVRKSLIATIYQTK